MAVATDAGRVTPGCTHSPDGSRCTACSDGVEPPPLPDALDGARLRPGIEDAATGARPEVGDPLSAGPRRVADHITDRLGLERIEGFSLGHLFSETFRRHEEAEIDELLAVGGVHTTPPLRDVRTGWPTPWMFARMLGASLAIFATLWFAWSTFRNPNLIPGLVMVGAFAVPLASVLFFFEVNAARNVSLRLVGKLIFLGGVVSVAVALVLFEATAGLIWWLGASSAGLVEEAAKLAAVLLIVRGGACARYPYILNGMLFGAAVGTGFAAFESAGYALRVGIAGGDGAMIDNIIARGMLSPLGHVVWTAIAAGALWRVKGGDGFRFEMLRDRRAYAPLALVCALHFLWNVPFEPPMHAKYLVLGAVAWIAAIALAQAGLRELARARADAQCVGAPTDPWPPRDGVA